MVPFSIFTHIHIFLHSPFFRVQLMDDDLQLLGQYHTLHKGSQLLHNHYKTYNLLSSSACNLLKLCLTFLKVAGFEA